MKSVAFAVTILIFNIFMSGIVATNIFQTNVHYESGTIGTINSTPFNITEASQESQQAGASFSILNVIFGSLSWNWITQFIPNELRPDAAWLVNGLNILSGLIISIGIVEVFWRRNILPGN